jgi:DNA segregation ATPase FtsK/SpoIIIE, S-DNA-T family
VFREPDVWEKNALMIEKSLDAFGIIAKTADVYEYKEYIKICFEVAIGTRLDKILNLWRDIAMVVASPTGKVVIEAPIPGKSLIGVLIPKTNKSKINPDANIVKVLRGKA